MTREEVAVAIRLLEGLDDKRLAYGKLWDETLGCGCVQGMLCPKWAWPTTDANALTWADEDDMRGFITHSGRWARELGLSAFALSELEYLNDSDPQMSPEERYADVLAELRARLNELEAE